VIWFHLFIDFLFYSANKKICQRKFFDEFAKLKKFSPLNAEQWYRTTRREIVREVSYEVFVCLFVS
jgi:hypothetical protein